MRVGVNLETRVARLHELPAERFKSLGGDHKARGLFVCLLDKSTRHVADNQYNFSPSRPVLTGSRDTAGNNKQGEQCAHKGAPCTRHWR